MDKVEVTWRDITHLSKAKDIGMIKDMGFMKFSTVGYLVYEDKNMVSIAGSILDQDSEIYMSDDCYREILNIPRANILKINKLQADKEKEK